MPEVYYVGRSAVELPGGALWTIQGLVASVRNWILFELEMTFSSSSSATGGNPQSGFACGVFVALYGLPLCWRGRHCLPGMCGVCLGPGSP